MVGLFPTTPDACEKTTAANVRYKLIEQKSAKLEQSKVRRKLSHLPKMHRTFLCYS